MTVNENSYIMIGTTGEIYHNTLSENFQLHYETLLESYDISIHSRHSEYIPTIRSRSDGTICHLEHYAKVCIPTGIILSMQKWLVIGLSCFCDQESESYMLGEQEDYIAVKSDNPRDVFVVNHGLFHELYDEFYLRKIFRRRVINPDCSWTLLYYFKNYVMMKHINL